MHHEVPLDGTIDGSGEPLPVAILDVGRELGHLRPSATLSHGALEEGHCLLHPEELGRPQGPVRVPRDETKFKSRLHVRGVPGGLIDV